VMWRCFISSVFAAVLVAGTAVANDPEAGEKIFKKCKACHQVGADAKNRIGPQLNGLFGRAAGSVDGAKYSKSMLRAGADGLVWTDKTLDAFLENPKSLVSKTRMSFRGLKDPEDRANVLVYLRLTCHKSDGEDAGIPSITAWPTEDFVIAMHAYKDKLRPHPVMQMMAGRLSNEEIAALAAYFEELE